MGIASGQYPEKGYDLKKLGLPVRKIGREYPYLLGKERARAGRLQIYYVLLPEYSGKTFFRGRPKRWKEDRAQRLLEEAEERAVIGYDCREQVSAPPAHQKSYEDTAGTDGGLPLPVQAL